MRRTFRCWRSAGEGEYAEAERRFFDLYDERAAADAELLVRCRSVEQKEVASRAAVIARITELAPERGGELWHRLAAQVEAWAARTRTFPSYG